MGAFAYNAGSPDDFRTDEIRGGLVAVDAVSSHIEEQAMGRQASPATDDLAREVRALINDARAELGATVNAVLTRLYWRVGRRLRIDVLRGARAGYGKQIIGKRKSSTVLNPAWNC